VEYRLSAHAEDELVIRNIPRALLESTLNGPQQIIDQDEAKKVYQSKVVMQGITFLLRVVVAHNVEPPLVITVYRTTKIERYWRTE
jgi:hypothetical protein